MATSQSVTTQPESNKWRYYCHGCTKTAALSPTPYEGSIIICPHCGKPMAFEKIEERMKKEIV